MARSIPKFVKKAQIFTCRFEICWDIIKEQIARNCPFTSNIKPEIGKIRPIVVVHAHKRSRLALVVPFTTRKPMQETASALYIPAGVMPGVLAKRECWALCDMAQTVSLNRLDNVYKNRESNLHLNAKESRLSEKYFTEIKTRLRNLFN
jgi:uncharacterized protein YifN (PemK superfamily)